MWKMSLNAYKSPLNKGSKIQLQVSKKTNQATHPYPAEPTGNHCPWTEVWATCGSNICSASDQTNSNNTCPVSKQHLIYQLHTIPSMLQTHMNSGPQRIERDVSWDRYGPKIQIKTWPSTPIWSGCLMWMRQLVKDTKLPLCQTLVLWA